MKKQYTKPQAIWMEFNVENDFLNSTDIPGMSGNIGTGGGTPWSVRDNNDALSDKSSYQIGE